MCGRFTASFEFREIRIRWNLQRDIPLFAPRYNIAPSQEVPVIVRNEDRNEVKAMRWGLVLSWAPDPSIGNRMINARAETLLEKPSFRSEKGISPISAFCLCGIGHADPVLTPIPNGSDSLPIQMPAMFKDGAM
jgi:putative SOS response-associated peptidase YedK